MALPNLYPAAGNRLSKSLAAGINASDLSIQLDSVSGLRATGGVLILDKDQSSKREIIYYSSIAGSTLTIPSGGRGIGGTTATTHSIGATVSDVLIDEHINSLITSFTAEHDDDGGHKANPIVNLVYPVGSVYISIISTSPATLFGVGTWVAFGAGKMLVSLDSGDTDFDTAEETGGAKTVTIAKANLPSYNLTVTDPGHTHNGYGAGAPGGVLSAVYTGSSASPSNQAVQATQSATTGITVASGGSGTALNVMNPYIVVYMWKRTA